MYTVIARLYLALVACGWGVWVFGLHQAVGYEPGYGRPAPTQSLGLACLLAGPLILGATFLANRSALAHAVRILAALALVTVLYLMLFFTWMWDIHILIKHIVRANLPIFMLGPPLLLAVAIVVLIVPEARALLRVTTAWSERKMRTAQRGH
jgi:hypothetical protein